MMLSAGAHTGTRNSDSNMKEYIWRRRNDGIHILNIGKTWEKLMLAARVIVAIENPEDVIAISARPYGMRAVLKFAHYTGSRSIAGRFTPGKNLTVTMLRNLYYKYIASTLIRHSILFLLLTL